MNGDLESSYESKKEIEDNETTYKFEYEIGDVEGEVKIIEITNEDGSVSYKYKIEEDGKHKVIDKDKSNDEEDEDDLEEENEEDEEIEENEDLEDESEDSEVALV